MTTGQFDKTESLCPDVMNGGFTFKLAFGVFGRNWSLFVRCCPVITHVTSMVSYPLAFSCDHLGLK